MRGCKKVEAKLFSVVSSDRTRGNGQKLKYKNSHLNIRKKTFCHGDVQILESLQREAVKSVSSEIFKTYLGTVLGNLLYLNLLRDGRFIHMISRDPF